ncbi:hypothetical protein [Vibrio algarum]|uniref:Uncharacterized protein n=1 Tax=Vibrio algarum TaxID=3020714 RepID=A0ABT4YPU6_9VIBR|nr:hypothetical protein [Vibrio sp. KJ40-1]MDB1123405.1 hypothetical protein [Vibrio sp. KJ40-1]
MFCILPETLIENAWKLSLKIISIDDKIVSESYLTKLEKIALTKNIDFYCINFDEHESLKKTLLLPNNRAAISAIEKSNKPTIVLFKNINVLVKESNIEIFWLRSTITTQLDDNLVCIFYASKFSIESLFNDESSPFYHSNINIMR